MAEIHQIAFATALIALGVPGQGKYVRLNPATRDVDIAFPERLEAKDFDQNPGPLKTMTVVLANHSEPTFRTSVDVASRTVTYHYVVHNAQTARQAITRIYMVVPSVAGDASCSGPTGWICLKPIPTPDDARALYYVRPTDVFVRLATPLGRGSAPLKPGDMMEF